MAKRVRYKPNLKDPVAALPKVGRLLDHAAREVAIRNNATFSPKDPRRVIAESSAGEQRRIRHRSAVIAASGPARRDQARTNRLLSALSRTRV